MQIGVRSDQDVVASQIVGDMAWVEHDPGWALHHSGRTLGFVQDFTGTGLLVCATHRRAQLEIDATPAA